MVRNVEEKKESLSKKLIIGVVSLIGALIGAGVSGAVLITIFSVLNHGENTDGAMNLTMLVMLALFIIYGDIIMKQLKKKMK